LRTPASAPFLAWQRAGATGARAARRNARAAARAARPRARCAGRRGQGLPGQACLPWRGSSRLPFHGAERTRRPARRAHARPYLPLPHTTPCLPRCPSHRGARWQHARRISLAAALARVCIRRALLPPGCMTHLAYGRVGFELLLRMRHRCATLAATTATLSTRIVVRSARQQRFGRAGVHGTTYYNRLLTCLRATPTTAAERRLPASRAVTTLPTAATTPRTWRQPYCDLPPATDVVAAFCHHHLATITRACADLADTCAAPGILPARELRTLLLTAWHAAWRRLRCGAHTPPPAIAPCDNTL